MRVAIIGGGAAGMMAVATLYERVQKGEFNGIPLSLFLFEKNSRLGAKVIISGGGRCNVTTGIFQRKELLKYYTRGADFLDFSFRKRGPKQVRKWFELYGIPLKEEDDNRVFPKSDDGKDIVGVFEKICEEEGITLRLSESVLGVQHDKDQGKFLLDLESGNESFDKVIVTTGGSAYRHTGSTGDGYAFAQSCGHSITQLGPSLNSFMTQEDRIYGCSGIAFEQAELMYESEGTWKNIPKSGPVLLTHFGITGPHVFVLASHTAFEKISTETPLKIKLIPNKENTYEVVNTFLKETANKNPQKSVINMLNDIYPKRFLLAFFEEYGIQSTLKGHQITKTIRQSIVNGLANGCVLHCVKRRPGDEFVTAGGVDCQEIDSKTMESKICPGLFFAGEVMNVDGVTGGFNLQASWATGRIAGLSI